MTPGGGKAAGRVIASGEAFDEVKESMFKGSIISMLACAA